MSDGTQLDKAPNEIDEGDRSGMVKLLKTRMRGGLLTVTDRELVLGDGFLGAMNIRRFPLQRLARLDLLPSPRDKALQRNIVLRFVWLDGQTTEVDGVGPVAAQRIQHLLHALRPSAASKL